MKCPSCSAQVEETSGVCQHCGHQYRQESPKKTMMGLPAMTTNQGAEEDVEPTAKRDRSTLFGIPAVGGEHQESQGLAESTAPRAVDEEPFADAVDDSEDDASTQVISGLALGEALGEDGGDAHESGRANHETAFGLPSANKGQDDDGVASAWGLAEESSEGNPSATQVAGAALADAIFESKQGAGGFSKTAGSSDSIRGTLMGMSRDEIDGDSTREVSRSALDAFQRQQEQSSAESESTPGLQAAPTPASSDEEEDDATQALGRDELAKFEERIQSDRRKQLLQKLRSKSTPEGGESASASPQERTPTGPRFSIPKPSANDEAPDTLKEVAVEPVDEAPETFEPAEPGFGAGRTSFPISSGAQAGGEEAPQRELSEEELEIALEDTGVVAGDVLDDSMQPPAAQPEIRPFEEVEEEDGATADIREFSDNDELDEPIFPIDEVADAGQNAGQVDLSADFEPALAERDEDVASVQRSALNFGETPASDIEAAPQRPTQQRPNQQQTPQVQPFEQQQQQPVTAAPSETGDPARKLINTVQSIFGVLGALFLLGAGAYGYVSGGAGNVTEQVIVAAPGLVGLLTVVVALLPLSGGLKSGVLFVMALLAGGALAAGAVFAAATGALLLVLGGLLLVLCAATFPLVLKVVQ